MWFELSDLFDSRPGRLKDVTMTAAGAIILISSVVCGVVALQVRSVAVWLAGALGGVLVANLVYTEAMDRTSTPDQDWYGPGP